MQPKSPEASSANAKTFALICLLVTLWGCSKQSEPAKSVPVIAPTSSREVGVKVTDQALVFIYEIRLKPALSDDPQTYICWFDGDDENGGNLLMSTTSRVEADAWIYAREPEIVFLETDRLTFAVQPPRQPVQVFKFSKPADTSSGNWSEWKKPDYVEDTTSAQFILEAGQRHNISTNVPQGCFEFRFKFVDFGKYTPDAQASPVILEDDSPLDEHTAVTNRSTPSP